MVDVILPVLNEAQALPSVLSAMPDGMRALVVDNGSTDGSGDVARGLGARVVSEPQRGFGAACYAGLRAAEADVVCFMDCDGSLDPGQLASVAGPVVSGDAELVVGARRPLRPLHVLVANRVLARLVRYRVGVALTDIGPMRAARRQHLLALELADRRFGWPLEMVVRAAEAGWRIAEVDVSYQPRVGRSKVTGTVRGTVRAARDMAAVLR